MIKALSPFDAQAQTLLQASADLMSSLYPVCSSHMASAEELAADNAVFLGAYAGETLLGIGGAVIHTASPSYAELKSIFISPAARGQQLGEKLVQAIEAELGKRSIHTIYLETGIHQAAAISLYEKRGYQRCPPFGSYKDDPLSLFMRKARP